MEVEPTSVARFAALLADPSRAAMCLALVDGRAWTVGELGRQAGIARSTATEHVNTLVSGGLLEDVHQGRHRYVRLADHRMAELLEDLTGLVGEARESQSYRSVRAAGHLAEARSCYGHLAGALGVRVFDALVARDILSDRDGLTLTPDGRSWFTDLLGDRLPPPTRQGLVRSCLDWTERRPHLGGRLGVLLLEQMEQNAWVRRGPESRAVRLTDAGERWLATW